VQSDIADQCLECSNMISALQKRIAELEFEVSVLRRYGNKDCTAQADAQISIKRVGGKCEFED
jgi:hypothetical protein